MAGLNDGQIIRKGGELQERCSNLGIDFSIYDSGELTIVIVRPNGAFFITKSSDLAVIEAFVNGYEQGLNDAGNIEK